MIHIETELFSRNPSITKPSVCDHSSIVEGTLLIGPKYIWRELANLTE